MSHLPYYTWITDNVAIGELNAIYDPFDIVINVAYINSSFNKGLNHHEMRETVKNGKCIYEFGLYDSDSDIEYFRDVVGIMFTMFDKLMIKNDDNDDKDDKKILFHCQSGKSRSVSLALAYICKTNRMTIDNGLSLIKEKRPISNHRPAFVTIVSNIIHNL